MIDDAILELVAANPKHTWHSLDLALTGRGLNPSKDLMPALRRLKADGLIREQGGKSGIPFYSVTEKGQTRLDTKRSVAAAS